jgi:hypothetical protein
VCHLVHRSISVAPPGRASALSDPRGAAGSCLPTSPDTASRLNVHVHLLALDGVYVEDEHGELCFHAHGAPSSAEVAEVARRSARRVHQAFKKEGRPSPWDDEHAVVDSGETDPLSVEQPGLFACCQAAAAGVAVSGERAGQPLLRLVAGDRAQPERSSDRAASSEPVGAKVAQTRSRSRTPPCTDTPCARATNGPWAASLSGPDAGSSAEATKERTPSVARPWSTEASIRPRWADGHDVAVCLLRASESFLPSLRCSRAPAAELAGCQDLSVAEPDATRM